MSEAKVCPLCHQEYGGSSVDIQALRDENARLREALKTYAECSDGCTCGDGWSHDPAQATLTPQGGKGGESE